MFNTWSITTRLSFLYTISTVLILVLIVLAVSWGMHQAVVLGESEYIIEEVDLIQNILKQHPNDLSRLKQEVTAAETTVDPKYRYYIRILDSEGNTLMMTPHMVKALAQSVQFPSLDLKQWRNLKTYTKTPDGRKLLAMTGPIEFDANGNVKLKMQMAFDASYILDVINTYTKYSFLFLVLCIFFLLFLRRIITRRGLSRLYEMTSHKGNPRQLVTRRRAFFCGSQQIF